MENASQIFGLEGRRESKVGESHFGIIIQDTFMIQFCSFVLGWGKPAYDLLSLFFFF